MKKIISANEAINLIKNGSSVMIGGFLECGAPDILIEELIEQGTNNLTMITNDTSFAHAPKGRLIANKQIKKVITSHIGTNTESIKQMNAGELAVELVPMGTLVERVRIAGNGLGGVLTPTGINTIVETGKQIIEIDGKNFILDKPLKANFALIYGFKVDKFGNVAYKGTTRNFNTTMATAADTVIVQAEELVECLDPNEVVIPGIFIDYIVVCEDYQCN